MEIKTKDGISVIIPYYNRESTIMDCVKSILDQNFDGNLEIIISDDGSYDNGLSYVENLDDRIIIVHKPLDCKDQGASGARNRGLSKANYSFISFLDSDDYYLPGFLEKMYSVLKFNPRLDYAFCRSKMERIQESGKIEIMDWTRKKLSRLDIDYHVLYRPFNINTNTLLIKKSVFDRVGLFDTTLENGNDTDMWIRISESFEGEFVDFFGAMYRLNHSQGQLTSNSETIKRKCATRIYSKAIQRYIESSTKDKLRLLLVLRMLFYMALPPRKRSLAFRIFSHLYVSSRLFYIFPVTFLKFLYNALRK